MSSFSAAAAQHGMRSSVHWAWGATLYHPEDLPPQVFGASKAGSSGGGNAGKAGSSFGWGEEEDQGGGEEISPCSRINKEGARFARCPAVMTEFRKALQAHTPVRALIPAPHSLPPLPPFVGSSKLGCCLCAPLPASVRSVYTAAGEGSVAALSRLSDLAGVDTAALSVPGSHTFPRSSAFPYTVDERSALCRLQYYVGGGCGERDVSVGGRSSGEDSVGGSGSCGRMAGYQSNRMQAAGVDCSTKLSVFMALGCLSARQVFYQVQGQRQQAQQAQEEVHASVLESCGDTSAEASSKASPSGWHEPGVGDDLGWLAMHLGIRDFFMFTALKEGEREYVCVHVGGGEGKGGERHALGSRLRLLHCL
jgi:deoxyribodipyrimidine photo-lyase